MYCIIQTMTREQLSDQQMIDLVACNLVEPWTQSAPLATWHGNQVLTFAHASRVTSVRGVVVPGHIDSEGLTFSYQLSEGAPLPMGLWPLYEKPPVIIGEFDELTVSDAFPGKLMLSYEGEQIHHGMSPKAEKTAAYLARSNFVDKLARRSEALLAFPGP